jgi:hypothetical protein
MLLGLTSTATRVGIRVLSAAMYSARRCLISSRLIESITVLISIIHSLFFLVQRYIKKKPIPKENGYLDRYKKIAVIPL